MISDSANQAPASVAYPKNIKSFVKRAGRTTTGQAKAFEVWGPQFLLKYAPETLNMVKAFGMNGQDATIGPVIFEIGFGMGEAHIEEQALHQASKHDQAFEQGLIGLRGSGVEVRIHDRFDEGNQELVFVANGLNFVVSVEDFAFIQTQGFHNVLVCVGMNGFFKGLAQ